MTQALHPRMSALPASSQTVVAYLGYLLESDTISASAAHAIGVSIAVIMAWGL
jgi:hypothetical protein